MAPLWSDYEFDESTLSSWTFELVEAAATLPPARRPAFLDVACAGSDALRHEVDLALQFAVPDDGGTMTDALCQPGDVVCDCVILRWVGGGGSGAVFKAIQRPLRRLVAVKILRSISDEERRDFEREAARLAQLQGPHIVDVYDADFTGQKPSVVMEYVPGYTLRQWLEQQRESDRWQPPLTTVLAITTQICQALQVAHARGIVHRDIKPENVLVSGSDEDCRIKVTDFGLARHFDCQGADVRGTPGYISPEHLSGAQPDRRADVFSVGIVLYEMCAGRHPFTGRNHAETLANTLTLEPELDDSSWVPLWCRDVVRKALRKEPDDRYASVDDLVADLTDGDRSNEEDAENPFLSEFPAAVRQWLQRHSWGFPLAIASFFWGCLSIGLSLTIGAACTRVSWSTGDGRTFDIVYGYVVEPNAGPWYTVGASLCFMVGFLFLHAAHIGMARTAGLILVRRSPPEPPLRLIAALNRRWFRVITPLILVGGILFVVTFEIVLRRDTAFGWVQADLAAEFINDYERTLVQKRLTTRLEVLHEECPTCEFRVARVSNQSDGFRQPHPVWFAVFLASALTHEALLSAFMVFIAAKFLFVFGLLSRALLGDGRDGMRLVPNLEDRQDARFGLGRLDNVYFTMLAFLVVCAVGRLGQVVANLHKGTDFFRSNAVALLGQALVFSAVTLLILGVILVPLGAFVLLTVRVVDRERGRLADLQQRLQRRLASAPLRDARARVETEIADVLERRRVLDQQRLLPTGRPLFWWLVTAAVIFWLIAPAIVTSRTGSGLVRQLNERICAACGNSPTP